jgi:cobalt-zinc-cadmium efflux system protein
LAQVGKDHSHAGHSHGPGHVHGDMTDKRRVLWAAVLTGGFMIAEAIGGLVTGSLALLADAGHMLTDSVALWLAFFAFRLAERPATASHSYGLGRVKTLVAYTNGITIFAVAVWICYEAIRRFLEPGPILGGPMLAVAAIGLLVNIVGFFILNGGDKSSLNMRGAIIHVLGDMLGSAAAIAAAIIIIVTGWTPIDPILSVLVAVLILSTAWRLMMDAARILIEGTPPGVERDAIRVDIVSSVSAVREVHHMHIWSIDGTRTVATMHACLTDGADPIEVVAAVKRRMAAKHGIEHVTVEPEFGECADVAAPDGGSHSGHDHSHDSQHGHGHPGHAHAVHAGHRH